MQTNTVYVTPDEDTVCYVFHGKRAESVRRALDFDKRKSTIGIIQGFQRVPYSLKLYISTDIEIIRVRSRAINVMDRVRVESETELTLCDIVQDRTPSELSHMDTRYQGSSSAAFGTYDSN